MISVNLEKGEIKVKSDSKTICTKCTSPEFKDMSTSQWIQTLDRCIIVPGLNVSTPIYQRDVTQSIGRPDICRECIDIGYQLYSVAEAVVKSVEDEIQRQYTEIQISILALEVILRI